MTDPKKNLHCLYSDTDSRGYTPLEDKKQIMNKYYYLILLGLCLNLTLSADETADQQKAEEVKISALTKDKVIFFSENSYFQDKTKQLGGAEFSSRESFKKDIVSLHHPFCTKDLGLRFSFVANFELKNKPTEKQVNAIIRHFKTPHKGLSPVIYFEIVKLSERVHHEDPTDGQVKIIGYGLLDEKKMRGGTASNQDVVDHTYFTKENFIPLSED